MRDTWGDKLMLGRIWGSFRRPWSKTWSKRGVWAGLAGLVVLLSGVTGVAALAAANPTTVSPTASPAADTHAVTKMCNMDQHVTTITRVDIRNNNFLGQPMCLTNYYFKPNFVISSSGLHSPWAAYPNAFVGCEISVCSPESGMPIQVKNVKHLTSSWQYHPGGTWQGNAAYDIWFNPTKMTTGQVNHGAEVMIWLNSDGVGSAAASGKRVTIDGTTWAVSYWTANHGGRTWNYVRYWRLSPTLSVTNLNLLPFFSYTENNLHKLSTNWWLTAVEAGYELWKGGVGMHTLNYSVSLNPAPPKPPAPPTTMKSLPPVASSNPKEGVKPPKLIGPTATPGSPATPSPSTAPSQPASSPAEAPATSPSDTPPSSPSDTPTSSPPDSGTPTPTGSAT